MNNKNNKNIYYVCSVNTPLYEKHIGENLFIGAAYNKVSRIVLSLRLCGASGVILSLPVLNKSSSKHWVKRYVFKENKYIVVMLRTHIYPLIRRTAGLFQLAFFCFLKVNKEERVIFYNISPEYLLGLFVLRLKNNPGFLDIEDAPRNDEAGLIGYLNRASFSIAKLLCNKKFIVASSAIANNLKLESNDACIISGVFRDDLKIQSSEKKFNGKLKVLLGGCLSHDTGVGVFCEALKLLSDEYSHYQDKIEFVVTGYGTDEYINDIESSIKKSCFNGVVKYNLTHEEYNECLLTADVSLCLKLPDTEMGQTTFPSKVIEICSSGALLISTKVSDVPNLFMDKKSALFLDEATAVNLVSALIWSVDNRERVKEIAAEGQRVSENKFSMISIGNRLLNFIYN